MADLELRTKPRDAVHAARRRVVLTQILTSRVLEAAAEAVPFSLNLKARTEDAEPNASCPCRNVCGKKSRTNESFELERRKRQELDCLA